MSRSAEALEVARGELLVGDGARKVLANIRDMATREMRNNGWARLFCELMGWVGTREQVVNALVLQLGVPIEQARAAVETVGRLPDNPHAIAEECRAYLAWYNSPNGPGKEV